MDGPNNACFYVLIGQVIKVESEAKDCSLSLLRGEADDRCERADLVIESAKRGKSKWYDILHEDLPYFCFLVWPSPLQDDKGKRRRASEATCDIKVMEISSVESPCGITFMEMSGSDDPRDEGERCRGCEAPCNI